MLALVLAAINLRPGITSFAPLIERIAEELALSRGLISLTTALPVLCSRKAPPPMPLDWGSTSVSTICTAMAASMAEPPALRTW